RAAHIATAGTASAAAAVSAVVRALLVRTARAALVGTDIDGSTLDLRPRELGERALGEVLRKIHERVGGADVDRTDLRGGESALVRDRAHDAAGLHAVV